MGPGAEGLQLRVLVVVMAVEVGGVGAEAGGVGAGGVGEEGAGEVGAEGRVVQLQMGGVKTGAVQHRALHSGACHVLLKAWVSCCSLPARAQPDRSLCRCVCRTQPAQAL